MIINGKESIELLRLFPSIQIPIYQDTEELNLWSDVFSGRKDDFIIFDQCGRRIYHIPLPYSNLNYGHTTHALNYVHSRGEGICGQCQFNPDPWQMMMGDAPIHGGSTRNGHHCQRGDEICRSLRRFRFRPRTRHHHGDNRRNRQRQFCS